jgi:aspartate aminotransferase
MDRRIAKRLDVIKPSATLAIAQRAAELKAKGIDVLSFSVGEPDFEPPQHVSDAAREAVEKGASKYSTVRGLATLRQAICDRSKARRKVEHGPDDVVVSIGAKHTLFNLALALFEPGDEVIIPAPYWVSYPEQVLLVGATPVIVESTRAQGYRISAASLAAAITKRTRAVILCSPSNPTGAAYKPRELGELADVLRKHDVYVITDEIYGELVYEGFDQRSILELAPDLRDRLIVVDGVSKTYAMTGWRIGWMLAPRDVAKACDTIQSQSTTNPAVATQAAALAALRGPTEVVEEMRREFEARREIIVSGVNSIRGLRCEKPEGAFYAWVDATGILGKRAPAGVLETDVEVAQFLIDEARCALVPGTPFGGPGHLRMSYAASRDQIREGLSRIKAAVEKLG